MITREQAIEELRFELEHLGETEEISLDTMRLAIEALTDIAEISDALLGIVDIEFCDYGFEKECDKAEKWAKYQTYQEGKS